MSYPIFTINLVLSSSSSESADSKSTSKLSLSNSILWVPSNGRSQDSRADHRIQGHQGQVDTHHSYPSAASLAAS